MRMDLSLPALERLIGGDSEIEVHIRQQIVDNFAKQYLKKNFNQTMVESAMRPFVEELKAQTQRVVQDLFKQESNPSSTTFNNNAKFEIKKAVEDYMTKVIQVTAQEKMDARLKQDQDYYQRMIDNRLKVFLDKEIETRVQAEVARRLKVAAGM